MARASARHILVEKEEMCEELKTQIEAGGDFDALVKEYTNDSFPGIVTIKNRGVAHGRGEYPRDGLASRFSDVAFSLEVDEIGLANYHAGTSPYGWHVIKRLE